MACKGALTSIVMTVAASYLANGGFEEIFGGAPISSAAAPAPIENALATGTTIMENGVPVTMGTAQQTVTAAVTTQNLTWYQELSTTLTSMKDAAISFTEPMREAWNAISTAPVAAGQDVWVAASGTFGPKTAEFLATVTEQSFRTALDVGIQTGAEALGSSNGIVAGVVTGDPRIVGQIFNAAQSYAQVADQFINAAEDAVDYLDKTFTNLDNTITAGISDVNEWFEGLADDISEWGDTVNWENLADIGFPGQLLANLESSGTLGPLYDRLSDIEIDEATADQLGVGLLRSGYANLTGQQDGITLGDLGLDLNALARQGASLPPSVQKQVYDQLGELTPDEVAQVKGILGNTVTAVENGQDLLDPKKLLSRSYTTTTTPVRTASVGFRAIYENESGSINPQLNNLGEKLKGIVPDDIAIANAALGRSFLQIKGINGTNSPRLAEAIRGLETLKDLPDLQNQTTYLPEPVRDWWRTEFGQDFDIALGTGNLNKITVCDVIGWIAGYNSAGPLTENAALLAEMEAQGELDRYTQSGGVYQVIQEFSAGVYGPTNSVPEPGIPQWYITIPFGYFAAGTYGPYSTELEAWEDVWINEIIPAFALENVDIIQTSELAAQVYSNDLVWQNQIGRETLNRERIDLVPGDLVASDVSAMNLATQMTDIGKNTSFGGGAMFFERVTNADSLGGQSTIAAMREGRNLARIAEAGIQQDAPLNTEGLETPGVLVPSTYDLAESQARVIKS